MIQLLTALRNCFKEVKEEPGYIAVSSKKKKKRIAEHQNITANHKNKYLNDFSALLCMGRCKSLDL